LVLEGAKGLQSPLPDPTRSGRIVVKLEGSSSRAFRDEVLSAIGDRRTQIVDARSLEEYDGLRVSPPGYSNDGAERAGRIPGAVHLPYLDLLGADGAVRPEAELRVVVKRSGLRADKPVIAYCRLSHRASLLTYVLQERLGFPDVRLYDGSWTEWGSAVGMPIE
jgi:thiosulfate/3-mercaptopyruvate sulfurtransferase